MTDIHDLMSFSDKADHFYLRLWTARCGEELPTIGNFPTGHAVYVVPPQRDVTAARATHTYTTYVTETDRYEPRLVTCTACVLLRLAEKAVSE